MSDASCCPRSAGALLRVPSRAPARCWAPERGVPEGLAMAPLPGLRALTARCRSASCVRVHP